MKAKKYTRETINQMGIMERNFPDFQVGDHITVAQRIKEGDKERLQLFEGDVLAFNHNGISTTFTVRKIGADSVAVERIIPYYSPLIDSIKLIRKGKVRRAKLYYMRKRIGKAAKVQEHVMTKSQREQKAGATSTK